MKRGGSFLAIIVVATFSSGGSATFGQTKATNSLAGLVWMRTDGRRITGTKILEEQDRVDRAACLSIARVENGSDEAFKGCMAAKGYALLPREEAERRLRAAEAIRRPSAKPSDLPHSTSSNDERMAPDRNDLNMANRRILALTESDRRTLFSASLALSGEACGKVTRTFYKGSAKPSWNAIWNVGCKNGIAYSIMVMSDEKGSTKVLTCGELRAIGGGECFVRGR